MVLSHLEVHPAASLGHLLQPPLCQIDQSLEAELVPEEVLDNPSRIVQKRTRAAEDLELAATKRPRHLSSPLTAYSIEKGYKDKEEGGIKNNSGRAPKEDRGS